jgi:cytoskeletal protein RodZ
MLPIPLPWLIVGVLISLFGTYRVGHHYGWLERDNDMKIAIAKKNDEARKIEQNMTEKLNEQSTKLQEANDAINKKTTALAVPIVLASCASAPQVTYKPPTSSPIATTNTEATSQPNGQTDTASDAERATLQAIAEIVAAGDRNTAALNACIDSYEQVRSLFNAKANE